MILKRQNWEVLLAKELRKPRLFEWGKDDCCLFVGDAIKAMTGLDLASTFRGQYSSALGAYKILKKQGYKDVADLAEKMAARLGLKKVDINFAKTGDIVSTEIDNQISLGIVQRDHAIFVSSAGYVFVNKSEIITAWAIN